MPSQHKCLLTDLHQADDNQSLQSIQNSLVGDTVCIDQPSLSYLGSLQSIIIYHSVMSDSIREIHENNDYRMAEVSFRRPISTTNSAMSRVMLLCRLNTRSKKQLCQIRDVRSLSTTVYRFSPLHEEKTLSVCPCPFFMLCRPANVTTTTSSTNSLLICTSSYRTRPRKSR